MTPDEYCQGKAAASGSSFYYSFLFLPAERRRAITAVYAYCREVDDAVDEVSDPSVAQAKLQWWRGEVAALFEGQPTHPVTRALLPFIDGPFGITRERLLAILEGMEMDLRQNRYLDFAALQRYAHLVAGVVGEISAAVFGYSDPRTLEFAGRLGLALQLINVIRDVGDDARRGRVYLPLDELQRYGVRAVSVVRRMSSSRHCRAETVLVTRISVVVLDRAIAAAPTSVLPAPQGSTTTPDPPSQNPSTASA